MNTKRTDDDIEDGNDKDDCNGNVVEDCGGFVVFRVVYVQTGQHQKEYACQNLEKWNHITKNSKNKASLVDDLEDDAGDDENEKNSVELVLLAYLHWILQLDKLWRKFPKYSFLYNFHTISYNLFYLQNIF